LKKNLEAAQARRATIPGNGTADRAARAAQLLAKDSTLGIGDAARMFFVTVTDIETAQHAAIETATVRPEH
jgi:hypothetical protein